jgi:uncharacterized protein involved in exopolysaccharide biosynthesis
MTPPRSIIGTLASWRLLSTFGRRALIFGLLAAICAVLAFYPERYRAAVTLTPADPESLGLSGTLTQLGAKNSVFGNQAEVEVALRVARSEATRDMVIRRTNLAKRLDISNRIKLHRWLEKKVEIRSLRGGIVQIEMHDRNPDLGRAVVGAFSDATRERLAEISRVQTAYKRDVLLKLVDDASQRLATAQGIYDNFRLRNRAPTPTTAVAAVSARIPQLEAAIKGKQIELASAHKLFTDNHPNVQQLQAELRTLQAQLIEVRTTADSEDSSVGRAVTTSSRLYKLERDLMIARSLYDSYLRYLQGTAVEDLTSTANMRILEPAYIDTERQIWWPFLGAAIVTLLAWGAVEFYRLRPPLGSRFDSQVSQDG